MNRASGVVVGALSAAILLLACHSSSPEPAAATVNGTSISRASLDAQLAAIRANSIAVTQFEEQGPINGTGSHGFAPTFIAQVLDSDVEAVVVAAEIRARTLTIPHGLGEALSAAEDPSFTHYAGAYRTNLAARTANRLVLAADLAGTPLTDASIKNYYDRHASDYAQFCVDGLAVATMSEAVALRAQLVGGAPLGPLARTRSVDPNTRDDGGVLGCGDLGVFATLTTAVKSLAPHTYSDPVHVGNVYYLITVTSKSIPSLEQAEPILIQTLITQYGPFNTFLQKALVAADVTVDHAFGRFDKTTTPPSVVAP